MSNKILFCTGEGIGNVIQCIPVIRTLKEVLGYKVDFWHAFGSYGINKKLIPYVDKWIVGNQMMNIHQTDYIGAVSTIWAKVIIGKNYGPLSNTKLLNTIKPLSMERPEVDTYMDIARDLGVKEEDILWYGKCNYGETDEKFDIVIHNGYNRYGSADWRIKSYPHYEKVVEYLDGLKVCSVGSKEEYIKGTENRTGLSLQESLGLIKNCRIFVGNDSGLYHCANALGKDNIVIFTATSIKKNYDGRFHKYSTIICRDDLECRPCQAGRKWKACETWECQNIDPEVVLKGIKSVIATRFMIEAEKEKLNGN